LQALRLQQQQEEEECQAKEMKRLSEFKRRRLAYEWQRAEEERKEEERKEEERKQAELEARRQEEQKAEEARRKEEQAQRAAEAKPRTEPLHQTRDPTLQPSSGAPQAGSAASNEYSQSVAFLDEIEMKIKSANLDKTMLKPVIMKIRLTVMQISASREQVSIKIQTLVQLIGQVSQCGEALGLFCLDAIADQIVFQGDNHVHLHTRSAFPLADVAVALCTYNPQLTRILMAKFHKSCCYTVPHYIPKLQGQKPEEHLRALGYLNKETEESYFRRMSGLIALYAAILQSDPLQGRPHPYGIEHAWTWMARTLNRPPRRITATLVHTFLQVAGYALARKYNRQFYKMISLIKSHTLPAMKSTNNFHKGSVVRLQQEVEQGLLMNPPVPEGRHYD